MCVWLVGQFQNFFADMLVWIILGVDMVWCLFCILVWDITVVAMNPFGLGILSLDENLSKGLALL
tara:strand:+ start:1382 stop:1576 length:195 start_codon:yes stop_codon:yes gene_type:complete